MRVFLPSILLLLSLTGCAGPASSPISKTTAKTERRLDEPERMIHAGDMMKITIHLSDHALGSLEPVADDGDVPTPEGSFVKAAGMTLGAFRKSLASFYATIPGYEKVTFEAYIYSSPYAIILPNPQPAASPEPQGTNPPSLVSTNGALASKSVNPSAAPPKEKPPTIYRRIFQSPLTVWQAIQLEGGLPKNVDPHHVRILKGNLERKTLDCSGSNGSPDGNTSVETNDSIFVVPDDVQVSKIFD